jgi:hypothetical protein
MGEWEDIEIAGLLNWRPNVREELRAALYVKLT